MAKRLAEMEDTRLVMRFTMREDQVYNTLTSEIVPQYIKEFVRMLWYGRVGMGAWQRFVPAMAQNHVRQLFAGDDHLLTEEHVTAIVRVTDAISQLIARGVLPSKDNRTTIASIQLMLDKIAADSNSIAWAEYCKTLTPQN